MRPGRVSTCSSGGLHSQSAGAWSASSSCCRWRHRPWFGGLTVISTVCARPWANWCGRWRSNWGSGGWRLEKASNSAANATNTAPPAPACFANSPTLPCPSFCSSSPKAAIATQAAITAISRLVGLMAAPYSRGAETLAASSFSTCSTCTPSISIWVDRRTRWRMAGSHTALMSSGVVYSRPAISA